jgi:hypothetical protein
MTMEVEQWVPPTRVMAAVYLTNSNIEEVAKWVKADYTHVMTDLRTRARRVEFFKEVPLDPERPVRPRDPRRPGDQIVAATVGQYIFREDAHVDQYGDERDDRYYALSEEDMQKFRKEQNKE